MGARRLRKAVIIGATMLGIALVVVLVLGYIFNWGWTGLGPYLPPTKDSNFQRGKTLWDWLNLLGVLAIPAVVGLGAAWYTAQQGKVSDRENIDNQRATALQAYIDKMSELLLEKHLRTSPPEDEVRTIARVRTITLLFQLDARRIGYVFAFLREAGLMSTTPNDSVVSLKKANLDKINFSQADLYQVDLREAFLIKANLSRAFLVGATLRGAFLVGANLSRADLSRADLRGANLSKADLTGADLTGADLTGTRVTDEQLAKAKSLKGATMPNGSIHP